MGSPIATRNWGPGPDTLVFLQALLPAATGCSIEEVALDLTTQLPMRVIGVDAPGFGQSKLRADSEYALGHLAALLAATAYEAGTPYVLAGHSWGAALAVRIAATRPHAVRGLVLLDGGHFDHAARRPWTNCGGDGRLDGRHRLALREAPATFASGPGGRAAARW